MMTAGQPTYQAGSREVELGADETTAAHVNPSRRPTQKQIDWSRFQL